MTLDRFAQPSQERRPQNLSPYDAAELRRRAESSAPIAPRSSLSPFLRGAGARCTIRVVISAHRLSGTLGLNATPCFWLCLQGLLRRRSRARGDATARGLRPHALAQRQPQTWRPNRGRPWTHPPAFTSQTARSRGRDLVDQHDLQAEPLLSHQEARDGLS